MGPESLPADSKHDASFCVFQSPLKKGGLLAATLPSTSLPRLREQSRAFARALRGKFQKPHPVVGSPPEEMLLFPQGP